MNDPRTPDDLPKSDKTSAVREAIAIRIVRRRHPPRSAVGDGAGRTHGYPTAWSRNIGDQVVIPPIPGKPTIREDQSEHTMNTVLVGMFDTEADAMAAQSKLVVAGFAASAVALTGGSASAPTSTAATTATTTAPHSEGAITRFFENLFAGDDEDDGHVSYHKNTYAEAFERGSYVLTVQATGEAQIAKAEQILNASGAVDVDERTEEWRKDGWTGDSAVGTGAALETGARPQTQKLQEVQEELNVGKRAVARGGVRVFTRLTEVPVEESVTLREERADIKRTVVDRVAGPADLAAFKEGSIEVREMAEEAVVGKTARVTGEVEVARTATEREETIRDTVRQTRVEVEKIGADGAGTYKRD